MHRSRIDWRTYTLGLLFCLYTWVTRILRVTRFHGLENFPKDKRGIFLTPNHPSLLEPQVLVTLFAPEYILKPSEYGPYSLADSVNYGSIHKVFPSKLLMVDRSGKKSNISLLQRFIEIARERGNIIGFLEGTRTTSNKKGEKLVSPKGNTLRVLKLPLIQLAMQAKMIFVPVWCVRGMWLSLDVYVGKPVEYSETDDPTLIKRKIEQALLALSDSI